MSLLIFWVEFHFSHPMILLTGDSTHRWFYSSLILFTGDSTHQRFYSPETNSRLAVTISFRIQVDVPVTLARLTSDGQWIPIVPISTLVTPLSREASPASTIEAAVGTLEARRCEISIRRTRTRLTCVSSAAGGVAIETTYTLVAFGT